MRRLKKRYVITKKRRRRGNLVTHSRVIPALRRRLRRRSGQASAGIHVTAGLDARFHGHDVERTCMTREIASLRSP